MTPSQIKPKGPPAAPQVGALYVHVPFCLRKCRYCDFYSRVIDPRQADRFVEALAGELQLRGAPLGPPLASIHIGGGTPTALGARRLGTVLDLLAPLRDGRTEFTVEANPGCLDEATAQAMAAGGVNRVSLGAQTFDPGQLELLGRLHDVDQPGQGVALLRRGGIDNIGLDLIFGIPGQTFESWQRSLEAALDLSPDHLSCYALSFEPGTELHTRLSAGELAPMDDALQGRCYRWARRRCRQRGLEHYEISNWARPARQSRHNRTYWENRPYLGLGPAAASYIQGIRQVNRPDLPGYLDAIAQGRRPPADAEQLTGRPLMAETLMLGLRLLEGISRSAFADRFGQDPLEAFGRSLRRHQQLGTILVSADRVRLSRPALFVSDSVLADIIAEA